MKKPQFTFFQGSSPTLSFALPYELGAADEIYATFSQQGSTVTEYSRNGTPSSPAPSGSIELPAASPNVLRISLTQEDTFLFAPGDCALQLRVKKPNGSTDTLFPVHGYVGKAQKEAVI